MFFIIGVAIERVRFNRLPLAQRLMREAIMASEMAVQMSNWTVARTA